MIVLVTGGCGFVGSSIALSLKGKYPHYKVIAFDNLRRRGSELNLPRLRINNIEFVHGDIRNYEDIKSIGKVDVIIEASAEPSVLAGLDSTPEYVVNTNLVGTINALNFAREVNANFIFLSTSRIYPIDQIAKIKIIEEPTRFAQEPHFQMQGLSINGISESFPLEGYRSIYGATKLSSELLIAEYHQFYSLKTVINRCGVIAGPWQMGKVDQGVVVLWAAKHFWKQSLGYVGFGGKGKQVRDILHVKDLFTLIDIQIHNIALFNGQTFNVGGGRANTVSLLELTSLCSGVTGNIIPIKEITETRQADIALYITDNSKINNVCQWKPLFGIEDIVNDIYSWLKDNEKILEPILK